ncbi:SH3 domain-containing protein [Paracraurococcus lichenis]|uniref:SH3 domain-containing protein n=1 Tax=Paracraurococcus lichenis TaxID=3064888 RepID=A0ABT9E1J9_9PROT|nr:SH3 domain-containing protein [Paracraurococcus sp. LOR1-02]MDO9710038.1 SH3 domain-containing protein [Paracraurococcus sp. LOR1-02]
MRKVIVALLALAACDDKAPQAPPAEGPPPAFAEARRAAEDQVRARLRMTGDLPLRAVQVWRQQLPGTLAVCGQVNPAGGATDPFIPWVAVVGLKDGHPERTDLLLAASNAEATRVFIEMLDRCWEGGGPANARPQAPRSLPPLPLEAALPRPGAPAPAAPPVLPPAAGQAAPAPTAPPAAGSPVAAGPSVTTTAAHPVNIRSSPTGGGAVVRIVPRASTLRVFGEAPGGWLEVGEDQPFGWVHGSMLER